MHCRQERVCREQIMRPQLAASDGPCVASETLGLVTTKPKGGARSSDTAFAKRATRIIGRALHGLPPSTWLLVDVSILVAGVYAALAALAGISVWWFIIPNL